MGSACCVAARDKTITNSSSRELSHRNVRYSPSWSFQWENRGRVAGEVTSVNWSGQVSRTDQLEFKSGRTTETAYASEVGSPLESFHRLSWQKSPVSERGAENSRLQASDGLKAVEVPLEVKEVTLSPAVSSYTPPRNLSLSVNSVSSLFSASPLSTQSHVFPSVSTPSRWSRHSPSHHRLLRQASDSRIPEHTSPSFSISELRGWSNASNKGSIGGSSDRTTFSEMVATSRRERWSFDSEFLGLRHNSSSRVSEPGSDSIRNCGVCSKMLTERSIWAGQKIMGTNEVGVVAVLICGHVYHAECLESMTAEMNKYDPGCPICTFGERQVLKLSEKALKAEMDLRVKNRRSRNRVVNSSDFDGDGDGDGSTTSATFNNSNNNNNNSESDIGRNEGKMMKKKKKNSKFVSSCSLKASSSSKTPFLTRHFSFGSKTSRKSPSHSKKGFFWSRSSKERAA